NGPGDRLPLLRADHLTHRCSDRPRRNSIYADSVARDLIREIAREGDDPGLGCGIRNMRHRYMESGNRGDVDNCTAFARNHFRHYIAAAEKDPFEISVHDAVPIRFILLDHRFNQNLTGVVHQDVDSPKALDSSLNHSLYVIASAYIGWDPEH